MRHIFLPTLFIAIGLMSSCKCEPSFENNIDNAMDSLYADNSISFEAEANEGEYVDEEVETETLIEEIYGEQWEFCDCVVKNDSINKVVEGAGDDADYDAIFARMEVIDQHCKGMLTTPNTTPEERDRHERRVSKCLRDAR
ncbi:hypothetical protein K6119_03595 [Paracrocinitomix mangrovi]|uniref:hypothetical protein n=1 Tax=Paracrocinitomix mangrovi TaxID=2862509 RepID=UPI001C8DDE9E|nr:hypothetical protein [Paracrocinitomix mangrovi]UKN02595.1 hypothetical protein K6119_03595 [Paracrocinitomix mangrovi]